MSKSKITGKGLTRLRVELSFRNLKIRSMTVYHNERTGPKKGRVGVL